MNHSIDKQTGVSGSLRRGFVLVIVLASLVFVTVLIVAFLASMQAEFTTSKSGYDASGGRLLANTCVNLAISQVQAATLAAAANSCAWASQPGMIRLYDDSGNPKGFRKLYSADNMVGTGAFNSSLANPDDPIPATWSDDSAVWVDLNAPVATVLPDGTQQDVYPIVSPASIDSDPAEGSISSATAIDQFTVTGAPVDGSAHPDPVPMPVKWLYVLQDGTVQTASGSGTGAVVSGATAANPIVGRVAFWTDDESCKININTASDGTFWDTPRFNTPAEQKLATYQPARGEYQRYPGHPAMVSLKSAFPNLTSEQIFALAPRLSYGGSKGETVATKDITSAVPTDKDRLYASVEEMAFSPALTGSGSRLPNAGIARAQVQDAPFFLTAASRAPELNLFGKPRVCIWPEHKIADKNYRTATDRLIAFCSTVGTGGNVYPFYFTREKSLSTTADIGQSRNGELLDYLDRLTGKPIPGFGGSFDAKYTQPEKRQILTEIFDYIRCTNLFDTTTPSTLNGTETRFPYAYALSPNLIAKLGSRDHLSGGSLNVAAPSIRKDWGTSGFGGHFLQVAEASLWFVGLGKGKDISVSPPAGAIPIFPEQVGDRVGMDGNTPPPGKTAVQAYFVLSFLTPGQGVAEWCPGTWVEISGLEAFKLKVNPADSTFTSLGFPDKKSIFMRLNWLGSSAGANSGIISYLDFRGMVRFANQGRVLGLPDPSNGFPFYSNILAVDNTQTPAVMEFKGGTVTVNLYADSLDKPGKAPGDLSQTLKITFPDAMTKISGTTTVVQRFPVPGLGAVRRMGTPDKQAFPENKVTDPLPGDLDRFDIDNGGKTYLLDPADVVRSMVIDSGDIRLLFHQDPLSDSLFRPHPDYFKIDAPMAHGISLGGANAFDAAGTRGHLIADAKYSSSQFPFVSAGNNGVKTSTGAYGDWDNGTSYVNDGPYINAPDEGASGIDSSGKYRIPYFTNSGGDLGLTYFSPNRLVPSAGMFGSLSTGVRRGLPWQTLLFRPGPPNHPGLGTPVSGPPFTNPPDHLLLDLFWMPVVEPYALSEPFSTAGKVNLNQQIVPFTYINRMTGLRAALAAEKVAVMPFSNAAKYKNAGTALNDESRLPLNLSGTDGTLRQILERFNKDGELFRSATDICDIYLVPKVVPKDRSWTTNAAAQDAWYGDDFALVGDNTRERPYADIYPRLTTKSNTYTVHYRAEVLRIPKAKLAAAPTVFDTSKGGEVVASFRGATTFERYLDPNDPRVSAKDPADGSSPSLESYYRFHVLSTKEFNP